MGSVDELDEREPRPFNDILVEHLRARRAAMSPALSPRQREQREAARRELEARESERHP